MSILLCDLVVDLLSSTAGKRYVYVSQNWENIDALSHYIMENVDYDKRTTLFYGVDPKGMEQLTGSFDGYFIDDDIVLKNGSIHLKPGGFTRSVNHLNGILHELSGAV